MERKPQKAARRRGKLFAVERGRHRKAAMLCRFELFAYRERETQEGSYAPRAIRVVREGDTGRQLC